jgi:putative ABC transport system permease protein
MIRSAVRGLAWTPGPALACIATLAAGIGAATAMFTLVHSLLLRPLAFPNPSTLFALRSAQGISWQDMRDLLGASHALANAAVYRKRTWGFTDKNSAAPEVVMSGMVTDGFFATLGVDVPWGMHSAWLSHNFWSRRYAANPSIVGTTISLNDEPYRVAGILPAWFRFPIDGDNPDLFIPLNEHDYCCKRDNRSLAAVTRLRPGISPAAAREELAALSRHLKSPQFSLDNLQPALLGNGEPPLLFLTGAAALLMLIAAANAAGILLARATRRARDAAIKISLGARLSDLAWEQIQQGAIIAIAASAAGLGFACAALSLATRVPALAPALAAYSKIAEIHVDLRVAIFTVLISFAASLAASLAPLAILRPRPSSPRGILVILQVAICTILLGIGAGLLHHLNEVLAADKGFRTDQIVIAGIGIPEARYDSDAKMIGFHERVIANLSAIPGVRGTAGGAGLPLGKMRTRFLLENQNLPVPERPTAAIGVASPELLPLLEIPILRGRGFTGEDRLKHPLAAIVNQSFAARYLTGRKQVGTRLSIAFWNGGMKPWSEFEIVGIAADARNHSLDAPPEPAIYLCSLQVPLEGFFYFARSTESAVALAAGFRNAVWSVDRNIERVTARPLAAYVEAGLEERRLALALIATFGALALFLAAAGLGATISAGVTESLKELGIRSALGESAASITLRVLTRGLKLAAAGLAAGTVAAFALSRVLEHQIAGATWDTPGPALATAVIITLATLLASALPARRAARLDPMEVLRRE